MAAKMDTAEVICGSCVPERGSLTCRINGSLNVPGRWDEERQTLSCSVPKERCVPSVEYDVLDASGTIICTSRPDAACGAKKCGEAVLQSLLSSQEPSLSTPAADSRTCCPDNKDPACKTRHAAAAEVDGGAAVAPAPGPSNSVLAGLGWLDRLLPLWIVAAMVLGVLLGYFVPEVRERLSVLEVGGVSLPIALGLWLMMLPVLTKVRYELLTLLLRDTGVVKQFAVSAGLNWLVGPALMTGLAWMTLPDLPGYRNGVIMVGLARCIAMVLLWNQLAGGHSELCAVMVALNSVLQIVLYAPLSIFYLQVVSQSSAAGVSFWLVAKSVLLFLGVPLLAGLLLRWGLLALKSRTWLDQRFMPYFGPLALVGLLYTIVVMFACQGRQIIDEIGSVARVSVPMLLYFTLMFAVSLGVSRWLKMSYAFSVTQAFTAASNNFELAIAVAVATFGIQSQEALAATVGPLIEVPVLLALVHVVLKLRPRLWAD